MAVYTEVGDDQLRAFMADYDLGDVLSCKGIAEGVENSNFLLHMERGLYILTLYEKRVRADDLPYFIGLMEHLAANGLTCPIPVKTGSGRALGLLSGRPAAVVTFLDGMGVRRPAAAHCQEVGRILAVLHEAGQGFTMERRNGLSVSDWRPLFERARPRADEVRAGLAGRIEAALADLESSWPVGLPRGQIHADLFPNNVFFRAARLSGVIDFYFACTDLLAYDLAIAINAWCFEPDGSYNLTKGSAMIAGYQTVRPLEEAEAVAFPLLCRGAALRFLLTRLYDWLNVPAGALVKPLDPLEYDRKLAFHRHVTDAASYGYVPIPLRAAS